jgi:hypothetical protein
MGENEPKIIIDEDWKTQVQKEKEAAKKAAEQVEAKEPEGKAEPTEGEEERGDVDSQFVSLVSGLAAQALLALGLIAVEGQKQVTVDIGQARFLIDTLMMLRTKTKGNLTYAEEADLTQTIGELQQAYVTRAQQAQQATMKQSGNDPNKLKKK